MVGSVCKFGNFGDVLFPCQIPLARIALISLPVVTKEAQTSYLSNQLAILLFMLGIVSVVEALEKSPCDNPEVSHAKFLSFYSI